MYIVVPPVAVAVVDRLGVPLLLAGGVDLAVVVLALVGEDAPARLQQLLRQGSELLLLDVDHGDTALCLVRLEKQILSFSKALFRVTN